MLFCHRCRHRTTDLRPIPTGSGEERYRCLDTMACNERRKWQKWYKKQKKKNS